MNSTGIPSFLSWLAPKSGGHAAAPPGKVQDAGKRSQTRSDKTQNNKSKRLPNRAAPRRIYSGGGLPEDDISGRFGRRRAAERPGDIDTGKATHRPFRYRYRTRILLLTGSPVS